MASPISVVINTLNEEKGIKKAIEALDWADEVIVVDDGSSDLTFEILAGLSRQNRKLKIFKHKGTGYVEPARNLAISKASNDWILILDVDEELPVSLRERLVEIASKMEQVSFVRIPRRNFIFGHFMQASMWWPDYNIRFFKKGMVSWTDRIHRPPVTLGEGIDLSAEERYAIIHHNYETITQFLVRMDRYASIQAAELKREGYLFAWRDIIEKPLNEFLSRFFAGGGYKDGIHGLALSFLQAFSFLIMYLKIWEMEKFKEGNVSLADIETEKDKAGRTINYWIREIGYSGSFIKRFLKRIRS